MSKATHEKGALTATKMRMTLVAILILVLLTMAGGFYLAYTALRQTAQEVADVQTRAASGDAELKRLQELKENMDKNADVIKKAEQIVSDTKLYQYQNQIIKDMTAMARSSSVNIIEFDFGDSSLDGGSSGDSAAPTAEAPAAVESESDPATPPPEDLGAPPDEGTATTPSTPSVNSTFVTIGIADNQSYTNVLRFIYLIENNISRMQIAELSLSPGENPGQVTVDRLEVRVYVRESI